MFFAPIIRRRRQSFAGGIGSIPDLMYYDPSDLSSLWQDTAGTSPVTTDGQSVARIDDQSGLGNHLTQATAGQRPVYRTDGTYHWLEFTRASNTLQTASISPTTLLGSTFVGVIRVTPNANFDDIWGVSYAVVSNNYVRLESLADGRWYLSQRSVDHGTSGAITAINGGSITSTTDYTVLTEWGDIGSGFGEIAADIDGTSLGPATTDPIDITNLPTPPFSLAIGGTNTILTRCNAFAFAPRPLTDGEKATLTAWTDARKA